MKVLEICIIFYVNLNVLISNTIKQPGLCLQYDTCNLQDLNSRPSYNLDEYAKRNCYCDQMCTIYDDCCENYPNQNFNLSKKNFVCNLRRTMCDDGNTISFIYSIGGCPIDYNEDNLIKIKCNKGDSTESEHDAEDKFLKWPFYSNITNYTYNNIYCAICNGEKMKDLHPWQAAFRCNNNIEATNSSQVFEKVKKKCVFTKWMSSFMQYRYCRNNLISTCLKNDLSSLKLQTKCLTGPYKVRHSTINRTLRFRNEFCAECSGYNRSTCLKPTNTTNNYKCIATEVTWSLFFDFNFFGGEYEVGFKKLKGDIKVKRCDSESFYDPFKEICVKIIYKKVNITDENNKNCKFYKNSDIVLLNEAKAGFNFDFELVNYSNFNFNNQNISINSIFDTSHTEVALICYTPLIDSSDSYSNNDYQKFKTNHLIITIIGIIASLTGLISLIIIYLIFPALRNLPGKDLLSLSSTYICVYVIMIILMIISNPIKYSYNIYLQQNDNEIEEPKSFKIIKQITFILAVLLHYVSLSTFSWISIISFDICHTLRDSGSTIANKTKEEENKLFKIHLFFGYFLLPFLPVLIGILLDLFLKDSVFSPNYGYNHVNGHFSFWISNKRGLFILFTIPVTLMLIINFIFFLITIYSIIKTDNTTNNVMVSSAKQSRQSRILLFIKLFSIMGISWLLGLLAGYFDKEWLFIIYTIANVFQGFFIFLTFITNRKVVKLLKRC
jgi:G protein-coupled receptor Mth (Methuselah protein)